MQKSLFFLIAFSGLTGCAAVQLGSFEEGSGPAPPDYSNPSSWAALPGRSDEADLFPEGSPENQANAPADVFFIHPTTYVKKNRDIQWNASLDDEKLNRKTDESTIRYQASVFNLAGRVYAPRYRQAHYQAYLSRQREDAAKAFALAYDDVRQAFEYYLQHHNQGRPILIAAHSQGAQHGRRLLKDYVDGKPLQSKLVAAYLAGMPVSRVLYQTLPPCITPEQTGCFCTWRTYRKGYSSRYYQQDSSIVSTNPLNWRIDTVYAPKNLHQGAILRSFIRVHPQTNDAQNRQGLLWVSKPKFPGSFLIFRKNYHIADYNLFYMNVRENALLRVNQFHEKE
ncbi:MAG: DUF3089 domain-containing protein [Haliscomenobacter sp.]|nr:DUF3089 domain-containing protein [Haliscomenobacter sp.]MBK8880798.1 DUF3089 domain-containing protein [Haliscomenobacter sp.]